jgi:PAS domain S-box-containing protein
MTKRQLASQPTDSLEPSAHQDQFQLLVENIEDYAILMLDPAGLVTTWNKGAELIKGYRSDEIIGLHFSRLYPPEDVLSGKPPRELEIAVAEGRLEDEGCRMRKDGTRFWADVVIVPIFDSKGNLRGFSKVTRDPQRAPEGRTEIRGPASPD